MATVAGVDFGTLSVRVSGVDSARGLIVSAISEYPLHRKRQDPDFATQSHDDHGLGGRYPAGRSYRGHLEMRGDRKSFYYTYRCELLENGHPIRDKSWQETIFGDHQ